MSDDAAIAELIRTFSCLQLPIGIYFVAPDGRFLACNEPIRRILKLPQEDLLDVSIADFYVDPNHRAVLLQKAIEAEAQGGFLEKEIIRFRAGDREIYVENHCKPLRDPATEAIVGYVGCLVDVTSEHMAKAHEAQLQNKVEELTLDIGQVLHANTTTLVMTQHTLEAVAEALIPNPFKDLTVPSTEEVDETIVSAAGQLADAIERLLQSGDADRRQQALSEVKWEILSSRIALLRQIREIVAIPEMRPPTLRKVGHEVAEICREVRSNLLAREVIRDTLQLAIQLERLSCLIDVLNTRSVIIQMDLSLRSLRDFITLDVRAPDSWKRLSVNRLIEQAVGQLAEFAKTSKVDIMRRDRAHDVEVAGNERDLVRTLSNLLHNAIKYSWKRQRMGLPWIAIRTSVQDRMVHIEFENWGTPIPDDELERRLIFQLGYRGKFSTDRGRIGTGIGLTDAARVAEAHGGEIRVSSHPASPTPHRGGEATYYQQAFVTTVTLCLPLVGEYRSDRIDDETTRPLD